MFVCLQLLKGPFHAYQTASYSARVFIAQQWRLLAYFKCSLMILTWERCVK